MRICQSGKPLSDAREMSSAHDVGAVEVRSGDGCGWMFRKVSLLQPPRERGSRA